MSIDDYSDEGILNLATALLRYSKEECLHSIEVGDYIYARIIADRDSRGIVGKILQFCAGDSNYLKEIIENEITQDKNRRKEELWH